MLIEVIVSLLVADVRHLDLDVVDDRWPADVPDSSHPRHGAHALITGLEVLGKKQRRRRLPGRPKATGQARQRSR